MKTYRQFLIVLLSAGWLGLPVRPAAAQNIQDAIEVVRTVVKADRQALVSDALQLNEAESKAFWPLYHKYRAEMDKVGSGLVELVLEYAKSYPDMTEDRARTMLIELGRLEKELAAKRASHLRKIGKVLPATKTLRFAQVESRLDLAIRLELAANIPLAPVAR
jgi:SMC interacting uncharacterized protein involved in chromosome segregation